MGYQEISIGPGCEYVGTVMHEMMHAVGFWHAQSRPDRNQVVEIMWENIKEGTLFEMHSRKEFLITTYQAYHVLSAVQKENYIRN